MQVITGITPTAPKLMLYSLPGVGKSTLASKLKKPIFLDLEGGLNYIDCARTEQITDLDTFYAYLVELYRGEKEYDTIVSIALTGLSARLWKRQQASTKII